MAKPLKTTGLAELGAFRRRVTRQLGMGRIGKHDADQIISHIEHIEAIVAKMSEAGEEELWP